MRTRIRCATSLEIAQLYKDSWVYSRVDGQDLPLIDEVHFGQDKGSTAYQSKIYDFAEVEWQIELS